MTRLEAMFVLAQIKNSHETMPKFIKRLNEDLAEKRIEALDLAIESLSADRVEVVRCGDCKFLMPSGLCTVFADECIRPSVSDFCSHGQRRNK